MSSTIRTPIAIQNAFAVGLSIAFAACGGNFEPQAAASEPVESTAAALTLQDHIDVCNADPRVTLGLIPLNVCVGADLFFREPFGGNGRTCGSCHPAGHNFTIDSGFIATLPSTDPLFIAEQSAPLANLEKPTLMRQFGLILENVDGADNPTQKFVMRSVPHCFSLSTSVTPQATPTDGTTKPPNERTGWSGDGAPNAGELRDFQTGAVMQHYTKSLNRVAGADFVLPTSTELDDILAFVRTIGRSNELTLTSVSLTDSGAESGRLTFIDPAKRCNFCHGNAGANALGNNRNFDTGVERLRIADLNTLGIPFDGGFGGQGLPTFNFDANHDATNDAFGNGTFNTPPLIEAADTGPFFHTNAFGSIEDAIGFYTTSAFAQSVAGGGNAIALSATEIANVGRFLRVLNASFNAQLAMKRVNGVIPIITAFKNDQRDLQQELAALALTEVNDAIAVLGAVSGLNASAQSSLTAAQSALVTASTHASHTHRLSSAQSALTLLTTANSALGTGMGFTMGDGTLMF